MTFRSWRAAALAVAAALSAPAHAVGGERVILFLSDRPADEIWHTAFEAELNADPGAASAFVVHRALPGGDERLLTALLDSYAPAAVVSRQALTKDARRLIAARALPLLVAAPARGAPANAEGASWSQYARRTLLAPPPPAEAREARKTASALTRLLGPARPGGGALLEAAKAHLEFGDDRSAERALESYLAGSPHDPDAWLALLSLRRRELRFWPALEAAERLAAVPGLPLPRRVEAALAVAELRGLLGDSLGAARDYERVLTLSPGHPAALEGLAREQRERPEQAARHAARAAAGPAAAPSALRLLAEIRLDLGDVPAARAALERALASAPRDPELLGLLVSVERGRPARAGAYAAKAEEAAGKEPLWRRPEAYRLAASMWRELGERERADGLYRRAAAVDPEHLESLRDLLDLRRERPEAHGDAPVAPWASDEEDEEMSEADLLRALDAGEDELDALRRLIERRIAQGRLRESAALTKRFLAAVPQAPSWMRARAYRVISRLAWDSGDPFPAWFAARGADRWALDEVRLRTRARGAPLEYRSSEVEVAAARALLGDMEGAERRLRRVLEVFPEDGHALSELFHLTASSGRDAQALALAGRVEARLSQAADRVRFLRAKAELQRRLKDESGARKSMLEALSLEAAGPAPAPERAAALAELGRLQLEVSDEAGAEKSLRAALALAADEPALRLLLQLTVSQRRFAEALGVCETLVKSLREAPPARLAEAYDEKARLQLELKDEAGAEESLRESARLSAAGPALPLLLERALARRDFREALSFAERLEAVSAQAPPARRAAEYYRKASIQLELKDEAGAEKSLERSLSFVVDGPALVSLLQLTRTQGRSAEALAYAERLETHIETASPRERAAALVQKAQIQLALKDEAGAEKSLERSLSLQPDGPALPMLRHLSANRRSPSESAR
ncbi:MAG: hypothetical protein Q8T11_16970 [Elusimicrobiota bacterium]|nr:hypothetical protein [Elusimicrobiota bacterium]